MQYVFMLGKGTVDDLFIVRRLAEKFNVKTRSYFLFVDLEKAFDWVPTEVIVLL